MLLQTVGSSLHSRQSRILLVYTKSSLLIFLHENMRSFALRKKGSVIVCSLYENMLTNDVVGFEQPDPESKL